MVSTEEGTKNINISARINKYAAACAVVASIISIIFGYDTGVMSGAMIFIKEDLKIDDIQVQVLAGILNICALVGSLFAGRISDYIGRRYTIVLASIIFLLGSVLMGYGPNYAILLTGRCVAGIDVGFALMIAPVYAAEISSPLSRGFLTSLPELCISLGVLIGYISNYFFAKLTLRVGWRIMLGIAAIPSFVLAFGILQMPESPRWLVLQGDLGEAKKIMLKVSNSQQEAETRLRDIKIAAGIDENCNDDIVKLRNKSRGQGVWKELILRPSPPVRWMLLAAIGIHFFEHATGIEAVVLYGPRIFKKAGITSKDKLLLAQIGTGITKTTSISLATLLLDKVGRRKLLLTSVGGMIFALSGLGLGLTIVEHSDEKLIWALALCIVAIYTYVMFFSVGLAPITWVYSSEIFPLKLRAQGASIGVAVNRLMNAVVSISFISIYKAITIGGAFFMFAGMSVLAWIFFFFFLPETRGRSLEEMEELFSGPSRPKNEASTAKYIVQQYIAATGGQPALNSVRSMCAIGQVKISASDFHQGDASVKVRSTEEAGGFVLWQKNPDSWCLELLVSGCKVISGSNGNISWRQCSNEHTPIAKGPPRPLRRFLQGLDPRSAANLFLDAVCIGEKIINDEDCFILKLETSQSALDAQSTSKYEMIHHTLWGYFSQRSGLMVKFEDSRLLTVKTKGDDGVFWETSTETVIEDYKYVDGVNIAHSGKTFVTVFRYGEQSANHKRELEEVWKIEEVDFNVWGLSSEFFTPPSSLKQ